MSEHIFKPGDTAVITDNCARGATELDSIIRYDLAEGDVVEVLSELDTDGDHRVLCADGRKYYIAARFLAPADIAALHELLAGLRSAGTRSKTTPGNTYSSEGKSASSA